MVGAGGSDTDRKSTRLNSSSRLHLVCRLLLEKSREAPPEAIDRGPAQPLRLPHNRARHRRPLGGERALGHLPGVGPCACPVAFFFFKDGGPRRPPPSPPPPPFPG